MSTVVPLLLTWTHSAIVKDPKPELCQRTGRWRSRLGPVHCVKIDDPRSARYNPLLSIRADDGNPSAGPIVTDAQTLAEMLAHAGEPDAHDRFWDDATTLVVTGLLIAARLSPEPTIATFYKMMRGLMVGRAPDCEHPFARSILARSGRPGRRGRAAPCSSTSRSGSPSSPARSSRPCCPATTSAPTTSRPGRSR